jgi:hypothetical protein
MDKEIFGVSQVMPAPGWRAWRSWICDGEVQQEEMPVVGWGVVVKKDGQEQVREVELLLFDWEFECMPVSELRITTDAFYKLFEPNTELTDLDKKLMAEECLKQEARREKRRTAGVGKV